MMDKVIEEAVSPFKEGLSIWRTELKSKGLCWGELISQKLEDVTLDNIIGQKPIKYMDAVGDHFKKICQEVADSMNPFSDGSTEDPEPDASLKHLGIPDDASFEDAYREVSNDNKKSTTANNEHPVEAVASSTRLDGSISLEKDASLCSSPGIPEPEDTSFEDTSAAVCTSPISSLVEPNQQEFSMAGEIEENISDSVISLNESEVDAGKTGPPFDQPVELHEKIFSSTGCSRNENVSESKHDGPETCPSLQEIDMNATEDLSDVELEDRWDDAVCDELVLISQYANKNISYKKKLRSITSKFCFAKKKDYKETTSLGSSGTCMGSEQSKTLICGTLSLSEKQTSTTCLLPSDLCDSDWELV